MPADTPDILAGLSEHADQDSASALTPAHLESMIRRTEVAERRASELETGVARSRERLEAILLESRYEAARLVRIQGSSAPEASDAATPGRSIKTRELRQGRLGTTTTATMFALRAIVSGTTVRNLLRGGLIMTRPDARATWRRHFDDTYYTRVNPDVAATGIPPALHYLLTGYREGREPSFEFSGVQYRRANPDVADWNPLVHFALHGSREGREVYPSIER